MKTEILFSVTFFLIGLIIGGAITAYFIWKYNPTLGNENEYDGYFDDEDEFIDVIRLNALEKLTDINDFKERIKEEQNTALSIEEYSRYTHLLALEKDVISNFDKRKDWFLSHIGKRIFPNQMLCECDECKTDIKQGILVEDRLEALSLFDNENASKLRMENLRYSDIINK